MMNGFSFKRSIDEGSLNLNVSTTRLTARNWYIHDYVRSSRNFQRELLNNDLNQCFSRIDVHSFNPSRIIRI